MLRLRLSNCVWSFILWSAILPESGKIDFRGVNNNVGVDPKNYMNFINIDQPIYRTYSAQRFVALLKTSSDALVNPAMWEDTFENFFLKSNVQVSATEVASLKTLPVIGMASVGRSTKTPMRCGGFIATTRRA